jgi:hypothetical protein
LQTIFLAALGDFSFDGHKSFSTILLIIYILLGNIILLNLLIAILSNTYTEIDSVSNLEYSLEVYKEYSLT